VKRILLILAAAAVFTGTVAAEDTYSKPGSVSAQVGLGLGWGGVTGAVTGGIDVGLVQIPLGSQFPLDIGIAGRADLSFAPSLGVGAYGTLHYSWKALRTNLEWLNHMETYLGIGLAILPHLGLDAYGGLSYHFNNQWAAFVEGSSSVLSVGAAYRF
jgi:opacity protein-like surface antigen